MDTLVETPSAQTAATHTLGQKPTLEAILVYTRDSSLTPRQQQNRGASLHGVEIDWSQPYLDSWKNSFDGTDTVALDAVGNIGVRVYAKCPHYPQIEETHIGTLLRVRGKITKVDLLGVQVAADAIIFDNALLQR